MRTRRVISDLAYSRFSAPSAQSEGRFRQPATLRSQFGSGNKCDFGTEKNLRNQVSAPKREFSANWPGGHRNEVSLWVQSRRVASQNAAAAAKADAAANPAWRMDFSIAAFRT